MLGSSILKCFNDKHDWQATLIVTAWSVAVANHRTCKTHNNSVEIKPSSWPIVSLSPSKIYKIYKIIFHQVYFKTLNQRGGGIKYHPHTAPASPHLPLSWVRLRNTLSMLLTQSRMIWKKTLSLPRQSSTIPLIQTLNNLKE
jgi:hypothetical protein